MTTLRSTEYLISLVVIDEVFAEIYGLKLDYIINHDIKYRMGLNGGEADADD